MTAQIEQHPREGRELSKVWRVVGWFWDRRQDICALIVYGLLYALSLAITYRDPVAAGVVAFLAAAAAILGHLLSEVGQPGAHL